MQEKENSLVFGHPRSFPFPSRAGSYKDQAAVYVQGVQEIGEEQKSLCILVTILCLSSPLKVEPASLPIIAVHMFLIMSSLC